jgi:hypothetical protein
VDTDKLTRQGRLKDGIGKEGMGRGGRGRKGKAVWSSVILESK